jgi:hypothetical protein
VAEIWSKFNKNERLVSFGAGIVIIGWLLGVVSAYGFGVGFLSALGAIAVLVIYYLKYAPNQNIQWPAPIETIVLAISAIIAVAAILNLVQVLGLLSIAGYFGLYFIALIAITGGGVLMAFAAWQEYQATAASRAAASPSAPAAAPTAAPPAAPAVPPASSAPPVDTAPPAAPPAAAPPTSADGDGTPPA